MKEKIEVKIYDVSKNGITVKHDNHMVLGIGQTAKSRYMAS